MIRFSFLFRVSLISCVAQPAGNHTISVDHFINLPSSTLVETPSLNNDVKDTTSITLTRSETDAETVFPEQIEVIPNDTTASNAVDMEVKTTKAETTSDTNDNLQNNPVIVTKDDLAENTITSDVNDESTAVAETLTKTQDSSTAGPGTSNGLESAEHSVITDSVLVSNTESIQNIENVADIIPPDVEVTDESEQKAVVDEVESGGRIAHNDKDGNINDVSSSAAPSLESEAVVVEEPANQVCI